MESRRRAAIYAGLTAVGTAVPLSQVVPWLSEHGVDIPRFIKELTVNRVSRFFGADVLVSAAVVVAFVALDKGGPPLAYRVLALLATFTVGVSSGLPMYLLFRERHGSRR